MNIKNKDRDLVLSKGKIEDYHHLSGKSLSKLKDYEGHILITGASGWLGKATLELLKVVCKDFPRNMACFGATEKDIQLLDGTKIKQRKLSDLESYPRKQANYLINLALF